MKRPVRIAALQLRAHDRESFAQAWPRVEARVEEAANEADLVLLPEGTIPAYVLGDAEIDDRAVHAAVERLRAIAARAGVVVIAGVAVRDGSALYNAGLVIDRDGSVAGRADKIFLWHFDRRWFAPGARIAPVATSLGQLGVLVCADGRMPEISRALVDRGAELLVMPTAWVSSGRDPQALENPIADLLGRMRAFENGVPFAAANKCGVEREMVLYCGKSQIVDDRGTMLALASEHDEEILRATVEIGEPHPYRTSLAQLVQRRAPDSRMLRVSVTAEALPPDVDRRLEMLESDYAVAPGASERLASLDAKVPLASVNDEIMLDPAGLCAYRRAGYRLAVWTTQAAPWTTTLARARAGEARMYVVVLDLSTPRAFVVDPDYLVLCGTFGEYRLASCAIDIAKTAQTFVAPGTDVAAGLERVHELAQT
jgi:predicted amidohydrolase